MKVTEGVYLYLWTSFMENNCNSFVIDDGCLTLIDPGLSSHVPTLLSNIEKDGIDPSGIELVLITHAHPDHFEGVDHFMNGKAKITYHEKEEEFLKTFGEHFARMLGMNLPDLKPDFLLKEGEIEIGNSKFQVYHTPGHSPGSISLYWPDRKALFTGDVIFNAGVGRTDFPTCDGGDLKLSIEKLSTLDVEYLLPGHGDIVSGRENVKKNFEMVRAVYFPYM